MPKPKVVIRCKNEDCRTPHAATREEKRATSGGVRQCQRCGHDLHTGEPWPKLKPTINEAWMKRLKWRASRRAT